jgi:GntR family transcriptional regulator, transcriptional repressor for pyruvate dehydrogenase complex
MLLRPVEKTNAYESVRRQLVELVKSDSVSIGDRLPSEAQLAQAFDVSRPVVREALGSLRALGLVQSVNGRGTFVAARAPSFVSGRFSMRELHEARCLMEIPCARLAARRRPSESAEELAAIVDSMRTCTDSHRWIELDATFHFALARASGNQVLAEVAESIRGSVSELSRALLGETRIRTVNSEHQRICDAVLAGDEDAAAQAMEAHLDSIRLEGRSEYGDAWDQLG